MLEFSTSDAGVASVYCTHCTSLNSMISCWYWMLDWCGVAAAGCYALVLVEQCFDIHLPSAASSATASPSRASKATTTSTTHRAVRVCWMGVSMTNLTLAQWVAILAVGSDVDN